MRYTLLALVLLSAAALASATTSAKDSSLDLDVLSSVVPITIDGKFVGTGVVVTKDGLVLTSYEFAPFQHGERIVVESDLPRAATVVVWDATLGIAVLQMHGVIPRPAPMAKTDRHAKGMTLAVYRTADHATVQIELHGNAPMTDQAFTPVFDPKTGKLLSVTIRQTTEGGPCTYGVASIQRFIHQAEGDAANFGHR
jgi:hypothetical protein